MKLEFKGIQLIVLECPSGENRQEFRKIEFALGREAANQAISNLGLKPMPISKSENGRPIFSNAVGSIAHTRTKNTIVAVAAVADQGYQAIGIDIEEITRPINSDTLLYFYSPEELLAQQEFLNQNKYPLIVLHCLKEAAYKLFCALQNKSPEYQKIKVTWLRDASCYQVEYHQIAQVKIFQFDNYLITLAYA